MSSFISFFSEYSQSDAKEHYSSKSDLTAANFVQLPPYKAIQFLFLRGK
jgi:hypothetical protein